MLIRSDLTQFQPAIVFAGELFEKEPALGQARSLLLDFFRGRQISNLALKVGRPAADAAAAHLQIVLPLAVH